MLEITWDNWDKYIRFYFLKREGLKDLYSFPSVSFWTNHENTFNESKTLLQFRGALGLNGVFQLEVSFLSKSLWSGLFKEQMLFLILK